MTVIVGEHEGANAEPRRGCGGRGQGRERGELAAEVIRHDEHVVAERLGSTGDCRPRIAARRRSLLNGEPKWMHEMRLLRPQQPSCVGATTRQNRGRPGDSPGRLFGATDFSSRQIEV